MRIKELLDERGWRQEDLAERMGVRPSSLSQTLSRGRPDYDTLERIATALQVPIGDLFEHEPTIICPHCGKLIRIDVKP